MNETAERTESVFAAAVAFSTAAERAVYLNDVCAGDTALRARIEALLRAHGRAEHLLDRPVPGDPALVGANGHSGEAVGAVIAGRYKLLEQIGEGGMGTVWMAKQTEPVKRLVALKLIKPGMDSKQVLARFEAERQALALMDHPNIAKVLDAGTTWEPAAQARDEIPSLARAAGSRPFFVMELVKGVSITKYCDDHTLTPRQRLELFVPVCEAIQHAHQKGIIHRDLKPSNVVVTLYDDRAVPKVIDFGVAKATGHQLTEETLHTGFGAIVGTVEYMSPEQASFNQLDVDTRSDVYSLGVLLYELLAGSPPFSRKETEAVGLLETLRVIREQEPPTPSSRLSTAEGLPSVAANRATEPKRLTALVRGELDWIVMKCLEKDRNRRYESASGLALDLQRYLADEPVQACPPSTTYRFRKWVRRNKVVFLAAATVAASLLVATTVGIWQAARATKASQAERDARAEVEASAKVTDAQRQRAERNAQHAFDAVQEMLTRVALIDVSRFPQMAKMRRELLEQAVRFYQALVQENDPDPAVRLQTARAYFLIAQVQGGLGQPDAESTCRKAQEAFENLVRDFPAERKYRAELAEVHRSFYYLDQPEGLEDHLQKAVALYEQLVAEEPEAFRPKLAAACQSLAYRQMFGGAARYQDAERHFRRTLDLQEELDRSGRGSRLDWAHAFNSLGILLRLTSRPGEAEQMHRRALDRLDFPADGTDRRAERARGHMHLAFALWAQERREDAVRHATEALALQQDGAADFPLAWPLAELGGSYHNLGQMLERAGPRAETEKAYRQALNVAEKMVADVPEQTNGQRLLVNVLYTLIRFHMNDDPGAADEYFRRLREFDPKNSEAQNNLAWRLATFPEGRYRDPGRAVELAEKAVSHSPKNGTYLNTLGVARYRAGNWKAAIADLEVSRKLLANNLDSFNTFFLAMAHWRLGNKDEARKWFDQAVRWMDEHQPKNDELRRFRAEADELLKNEDKSGR